MAREMLQIIIQTKFPSRGDDGPKVQNLKLNLFRPNLRGFKPGSFQYNHACVNLFLGGPRAGGVILARLLGSFAA